MLEKIIFSLLPYAFDYIVKYIRSSNNGYDDKILDLVKVSCGYLATQKNNDVTIDDAVLMDSKKILDDELSKKEVY